MKPPLQALAVAFLFGLAFCGWMAWEARRSERGFAAWPTVEGRVISRAVVKRLMDPGSGGVGRPAQPYWVFEIAYAYAVSGATYTGHGYANSNTREAAGVGQQPSRKLATLADRYQPGAPVLVHYRPDAPQTAVLVVDRSASGLFAGVALACALGLIAVVALGLTVLR